jgi:hypothetical protein
MKPVCYAHGREVDEGRAYCADHWGAMTAERLPYISSYLARAADDHPEVYNPRRSRTRPLRAPARNAARRR